MKLKNGKSFCRKRYVSILSVGQCFGAWLILYQAFSESVRLFQIIVMVMACIENPRNSLLGKYFKN